MENGKIFPLPKLIVFVLDDDLIRLFTKELKSEAEEADIHLSGFSKPMTRVLNHIMTHLERSIASFKENLPAKCLQAGFPQILWIHPPSHVLFSNNSLRYKFGKCLEELAKIHDNTFSLMLKKVWDPNDKNLYMADRKRYTVAGFRSYWEAVDKTIRYCDAVLLKKQEKKKFQKGAASISGGQKDQFRWQNPTLNCDITSENQVFCHLPAPPMS